MRNGFLKTIALVGNPNTGKTSLFNILTGLNQKTGNFPGVTVDKKVGKTALTINRSVKVIDLPGTYSLYAKSPDEQVVYECLVGTDEDSPEVVVCVADATNLKRCLLLFTQLVDFGIPCILALNMVDLVEKTGNSIDFELLSKRLGVPVMAVNSRTGAGIARLKQCLDAYRPGMYVGKQIFKVGTDIQPIIAEVQQKFFISNEYQALQLIHQFNKSDLLSPTDKQILSNILSNHRFKGVSYQTAETIHRYERISSLLENVIGEKIPVKVSLTTRLDAILTHKVWGFLIFFAVLFLIFQAIFSWASYPMDLLDSGIAELSGFLTHLLPESLLTKLLTDGIIAGLGGVLIFIPQIAILFALIALLEESGYMARVMFIMDRIMRIFGLNGRTVVPLISGVACAVPAIMSARSIDNYRERMISIFITPLMSCSARLPVFTVLIALMVPAEASWGIFNLQGLILMAMYLTGFVAALLSGWLANVFLGNKDESYFVMEMPVYRVPLWSNVGLLITEKIRAFVFEAGKVIVAISMLLWVLSTFGPGDKQEWAEKTIRDEVAISKSLTAEEVEAKVASARLEVSYAGYFGKFIEPMIKPLGFDWKIGIALITSFAAREVFIGTMSTIYAIGSDGNESTVVERMKTEKRVGTNVPMYTPALAMSLMVFYLFAMQCMSTLAVTYRETNNWKYPLLQLVYMTGLAYLSSLAVWQIFG